MKARALQQSRAVRLLSCFRANTEKCPHTFNDSFSDFGGEELVSFWFWTRGKLWSNGSLCCLHEKLTSRHHNEVREAASVSDKNSYPIVPFSEANVRLFITLDHCRPVFRADELMGLHLISHGSQVCSVRSVH